MLAFLPKSFIVALLVKVGDLMKKILFDTLNISFGGSVPFLICAYHLVSCLLCNLSSPNFHVVFFTFHPLSANTSIMMCFL